MNKQQIKGEAKKLEGRFKEAAGKLTGNKKLEAEGKLKQIEGDARKLAGDVEQTAEDAV